MDEIFVLSGFRRSGPGTAERILDDEINAWLMQLDQRGATVLFIADACHGGGMTRDADLRAGEPLIFRSAGEISLVGPDELNPVSTAKDAHIEKTNLPRVTFLAAADKQTKSPEVRIPGQPTLRGALSYSLARAFEGAADRNGDGKVTRRELFEYSRQVVYQHVADPAGDLYRAGDDPKLDDLVYRFARQFGRQAHRRCRLSSRSCRPPSGFAWSMAAPMRLRALRRCSNEVHAWSGGTMRPTWSGMRDAARS